EADAASLADAADVTDDGFGIGAGCGWTVAGPLEVEAPSDAPTAAVFVSVAGAVGSASTEAGAATSAAGGFCAAGRVMTGASAGT
ncbi:MAG: hypothetical protein KGI34_25260, partial [Bradyrhizobium sp.]|nr:hypothetical protein [Bradyrhizobium sp.]